MSFHLDPDCQGRRTHAQNRWAVAGALLAIAAAGTLAHAQLPGVGVDRPAARLDPSLEQRLAAPTTESLRVIVSFHGRGAPSATQLAALGGLGVSGTHLRSFPIAGVTATPAQIRQIAALPGVRSVYLDAPLQYDNEGATRLTGVDKLRNDAVLTAHNGGAPYRGRGVTVLVNDSGIDGTHDDLRYPEHVIQNVYAGPRGAASGIVAIDWIENVPNTDFTTSHGTHVAGIAGGSGARSDGRYEGVAPGAALVGYGSGAALFVLDALGGFDYAHANAERYGIRIVTNSFGNNSQINQPFDPEDPTVRVTQALAEDKNMVVVFSAGNSGPGENTITGVFKKAPWVVLAANGTKQGRLSGSSSRGRIGYRDTWTDAERGVTYTLTDRPTVIAPGTSIVSTRPASVDPLAVAAAHVDDENPQHTPFYMSQSGTSMAAPHVAGIIALMLEANPALGWREVKAILEKSATNVADLGDWEGGAGYANAYAAVAMAAQRAGSAVQRQDYGDTNRFHRPFNARAVLGVTPIGTEGQPSFTITYTPLNNPVTGDNFATFEVGPRAHLVLASGNVDPEGTGTGQTLRVALQDPDGVLYSPGVPIPGGALSGWRFVTAPAKPGTWKVLVRGTCGLTGTVSVNVCTQGVETNGVALPAIVDVFVKTVDILRFEGLPDVGGHARQADIERAIASQLVDSRANGRFQPDAALTRIELADYLSLTPGLRQTLPLSGVPTFTDLGASERAEAEAAAAHGGMLPDPNPSARPTLEISGSRFKPSTKVNRLQLAYSLVQALGLEAAAAAHDGPVTYPVDGQARDVGDLGDVPAALLGYVQLALDRRLIVPVVSGTTVSFRPSATVTRAEYASAALAAAAAYAPRVP